MRRRTGTARTRRRLPGGHACPRRRRGHARASSGPEDARDRAASPRSAPPARSPTARAPPATPAAPRGRGGARRRAPVSRATDEPISGRLRDVAHLPARGRNLVAQAVGSSKVLGVACLAAPLRELGDLRGRLLDLGERAEPEQPESPAQRHPLLSVSPRMEERERLGGVEVVVENGRELVPEDLLPTLVARLLLAKEVAEGLDLRLRLHEDVVAELDRVPPVSAEEEHQRDLTPPGVEDVAQRHVVAQ